jgi:hypothetical protein
LLCGLTAVTTTALREELARLGFEPTTIGRDTVYLGRSIAIHAEAIRRHLRSTAWVKEAAGNRRSAVRLDIGELPPIFARRSRRGGLMRYVIADLYAGVMPRPLNELLVTAAAHQQGLPVVEPMGAIVEKAGPWLYRGWFLTRALEGRTLWNLLLSGAQGRIRRDALRQARAAIDRMHDGGLYHADLNFHNLLVGAGKRPKVIVLDLDKARLYPNSLPPPLRRANFSRLARSARRLAEAGAVLTPAESAILGLP